MLLAERILTMNDRERLLPLVDQARRSWLTYAPYLDAFRSELRRTRALPSAQVPPDVITMNSRFVLSRPREEGSACYTLVYPEEQSPREGRISVLSPMGVALLGARAGEEVAWISSDGPEVATVQRLLYQPEADGAGARGR